jgi:hypothetical protein
VLAMKKESKMDIDKIQYLTKDNCEKTVEALVMDQLRVTKVCCRRILMTHKDI